MPIHTRHVGVSVLGLIAVIQAIVHDYPSFQTNIITIITALITFIDWIMARIREYQGVYHDDARQTVASDLKP